jgi:outer membrane protein assembly factor BamB
MQPTNKKHYLLVIFLLIAAIGLGYGIGRSFKLPIQHATMLPASPSQPYGYDVPVQPDSPWPTFRRDRRNSGASPLPAEYTGDQPWAFQTGKGIFSTPIIDADGIIYVGSADHYFYAINPDGSLNWKYETGEIIDSAGALTPGAVTFISGDGHMYHFRTGNVPLAERPIWVYAAQLRPGISYNRWFEGNVAVGFDGAYYSGNTNFLYYAINPDGSLKWSYPTTSNNWSMAAFGDDGSIYWASLDTYIRGVAPDSKEIWRARTLGFVAASAAVGSDGSVYIGSFDSNLYALDPQDGSVKWKFPTTDHIYASVALSADKSGKTNAILFGSADGTFYAVDPQGKLLWKYDTGDVIRSSPAVGLTPDGKGKIVYFGAGNGKLYALNLADGSLRWAIDTTSTETELADRNDLNGSVALGKTGVYIGGEHGQLWYVPYEYCLHAQDPRCSTQSLLPDTFTGLYYVSPGGNTRADFPAELPASTMLTLRLVVRQAGETIAARICDAPVGCPADALAVSLEPAVKLDVNHSADGKYIYIRPREFLQPGQMYTLKVSGKYYTGGLRVGNLTIGGAKAGDFRVEFRFQAASSSASFPMPAAGAAEKQVTAFEWTRLAAPIPPMLPSLNQIGFDYMDWIAAPLLVTPADQAGKGKFILWVIGAKRAPDGTLVPDPQSDFTLPLNGRYQGADFVAVDQNFPMPITGINMPFNLFELRGALNADGTTTHPAVFASTDVLSIPTFGPYLVVAGLANNWYKELLVSGTFVTRAYHGFASQAPQGIRVSQVSYLAPAKDIPGSLTVALKLDSGITYPAADHRAGLVLVDPATNAAVYMDYKSNLSTAADENGNIRAVTLTLPKGMHLPENTQVYVMLDLYPIEHTILSPTQ